MINFQSGEIAMPRLNPVMIEKWLTEVAGLHGFEFGTVNYRFCDDKEILNVNREFVGHDYYTDIITFDYARNGRVNGDILISLETVASNAELLKVPYSQELMRVIAHGVLHLCGINDKTPTEREEMESAENEALNIWYDHFDCRKEDLGTHDI